MGCREVFREALRLEPPEGATSRSARQNRLDSIMVKSGGESSGMALPNRHTGHRGWSQVRRPVERIFHFDQIARLNR